MMPTTKSKTPARKFNSTEMALDVMAMTTIDGVPTIRWRDGKWYLWERTGWTKVSREEIENIVVRRIGEVTDGGCTTSRMYTVVRKLRDLAAKPGPMRTPGETIEDRIGGFNPHTVRTHGLPITMRLTRGSILLGEGYDVDTDTIRNDTELLDRLMRLTERSWWCPQDVQPFVQFARLIRQA